MLVGRVTIKTFKENDRFIGLQAKLTDENHVFNLSSCICNRFLSTFIDFASNLLVVGACVLAVYGRDNSTPIGAGKASLSLSTAISVSSILYINNNFGLFVQIT